MQIKNYKINKGFTLIELLVVIAIIGILASLITVSFSSTQRQARDTQRKSDLSQYRTAVENYASRNNGTYIVAAAAGDTTGTLCTGLVTAQIVADATVCPSDPKYTPSGSQPNYQYQTDASGTTYALWAKLENAGTASNLYWLVCSTGISKTSLTAPSLSTCSSAAPATPAPTP